MAGIEEATCRTSNQSVLPRFPHQQNVCRGSQRCSHFGYLLAGLIGLAVLGITLNYSTTLPVSPLETTITKPFFLEGDLLHKNESAVDVVIVAGAVNCVINRTVEALRAHLTPPVSTIYVVLPLQLVGICQRVLSAVECIDENFVLGMNKEKIGKILREKGPRWAVGARSSWFHQQLLKLMAVKALPALRPLYAVWDSDLVLRRPYSLVDEYNRIKILSSGGSNNIYHVTTKALLGYSAPRKDMVTHFMGVRAGFMNSMLEQLCPGHADDRVRCSSTMLQNIPSKQPNTYAVRPEFYSFSEYTLYHAFVLNNHGNTTVVVSGVKQHRLQRQFPVKCNMPRAAADVTMTVLEHYSSGHPDVKMPASPKALAAPDANYVGTFLETAKRKPCQNDKIFVEAAVTRWYCLDDIPPGTCIVYSFEPNPNQQRNFANVFDSYGCKVHSYGHSSVQLLETLMKENGDTYIDVLRINAEGNEWKWLGRMIESNVLTKIRYFSFKIHMLEKWGSHEFFYHYLSGIPMRLLFQSPDHDAVDQEAQTELWPGAARVYELLLGEIAQRT